MQAFEHITVLADAAIAALEPAFGEVQVDLTSGGGGHGVRMLQATGAGSQLIAFDRDPVAVEASRRRFADYSARAEVVCAPFSQAPELLIARGIGRDADRGVNALIADLGVSSPQIDDGERGFSIQADGPLDMRMSDEGETAAELLDRLSVEELANILWTYGEIRESRRLARAIHADRAAGLIETTGDLAGLCRRVLRNNKRSLDPATLPFQALRIAVNGELDELDAVLDALPALLADGGRAAFISFHSLEDRRIKQAFRALSRGPEIPRGVPVRAAELAAPFRVVGKPVTASAEELAANPRARSARLRVIERIAPETTHG